MVFRKPLAGNGVNPFPKVVANLALNPGCDNANIAGWNTNDGTRYTLTPDSTAPISGTFSAMSTRLAASPSNAVSSLYLNGGVGAGTNIVPVTPGVSFTGALDIKVEVVRNVTIGLNWRDAANGVLAGTVNQTVLGQAAGVVQRFVCTGVAPPTAAFAYLSVAVTTAAGNAPTGERVWLDNMYLGPDPTGTYIDGDMAGYFWEGGRSRSRTMKYGAPIPSARNMLLSPYDPGAAGAISTEFDPYQSVIGSIDARVGADVNLMPNPRFNEPLTTNAVLTARWTPVRATVVQDPTVTRTPGGPPSAKMTITASDSSAYILTGNAVQQGSYLPVLGGATYTVKVSVFPGPGAGGAVTDYRPLIYQFDAAGAFTSTTGGSYRSTPDGQWTDLTDTITLQPGTVGMRIGVLARNPVPIGLNYWVAEPMWVLGSSAGPYFDGSQSGNSWSGAANASPSYRPVTYRGRPVVRAQALGTTWPVQPNLITNGTFEGGVLTGWGVAGGSQSADATIKHSGSHSLKMTYASAASGQGTTTNVSGLTVGQAYTVEGWIYVPAATLATTPQIALRMSGIVAPWTTYQYVLTADTWVQTFTSFTASATSHQIFWATHGPTNAGAVAYLDDVKLYAQQNLCVAGENGTFENANIGGFTAVGMGAAGAVASSTTQKHSGTYSLRATWDTVLAVSGGPNFSLSGLTVGAQYTFEAWLYVPAASLALQAAVRVGGQISGNPVTVADTWTLSTLTFTAATTSHTFYAGVNLGNATAGMIHYADDVRVYKSTASTRAGIRTHGTNNLLAVPAGTRVVVSVDLFLSTAYATIPSGVATVQCIMRDDVNNDSNCATFDPSTPSAVNFDGTAAANKWVRLSWVATVNSGRNLTGVYFAPAAVAFLPAGAYADYGPVTVMVDGEGGTAPYFDGSSPGCAWAGAVDQSVSTRYAQLNPYNLWDGSAEQPLSWDGEWNGAVLTPTPHPVEIEVLGDPD